MNSEYQHLPNKPLTAGTAISHNMPGKNVKITRKDAALSMMTDFKFVRPFSIPANATIDEANAKMIACGVRLLFVSENNGTLHGLITYNDIFGEKPIRYIQEYGGKHNEILVQDIMTPSNQLEALQLTDILEARIGDIVETFKFSGRQHILVTENQSDGSQFISGLFSVTEIEKKLKIRIEVVPRTKSFAEVERVLVK